MYNPVDHDDSLKEYCGIVGIYGDEDASEKVYLGLYALQHRGQGAPVLQPQTVTIIRYHKGLGLVRSVFSDSRIMPRASRTFGQSA
jgi:amidophosphoribosyltransferase